MCFSTCPTNSTAVVSKASASDKMTFRDGDFSPRSSWLTYVGWMSASRANSSWVRPRKARTFLTSSPKRRSAVFTAPWSTNLYYSSRDYSIRMRTCCFARSPAWPPKVAPNDDPSSQPLGKLKVHNASDNLLVNTSSRPYNGRACCRSTTPNGCASLNQNVSMHGAPHPERHPTG